MVSNLYVRTNRISYILIALASLGLALFQWLIPCPGLRDRTPDRRSMLQF
jgi:hypothetical protein